MAVRKTLVEFEKRSVMLFAAITLGTSGSAWSQSASTPQERDQSLLAMFAQADNDGDKRLNADEAKVMPALLEQLTEVDTDGDGAVSEAEFMASLAPPHQ